MTPTHPPAPPELLAASFLSPQITRWWPLAALALALLVLAAPTVRSLRGFYLWARAADRSAREAAASRRPKAPASGAATPRLSAGPARDEAALALAVIAHLYAHDPAPPAPYALLVEPGRIEVLLAGSRALEPRAPWTATAPQRWSAEPAQLAEIAAAEDVSVPARHPLAVLGAQREGWVVVDLAYCPGTIVATGPGAGPWIEAVAPELSAACGIDVGAEPTERGRWTVRIERNGRGVVEELGLPFDTRPLTSEAPRIPAPRRAVASAIGSTDVLEPALTAADPEPGPAAAAASAETVAGPAEAVAPAEPVEEINVLALSVSSRAGATPEADQDLRQLG
ncbi:hypothetical protein KDL01_28270 [Actinospica durhamensis]|uniref:Uncharacterized protein n=1 Tax=Actinospica durhamensis TaxID=1508375 RepID=A0A941IVH3_9ACTN|nr:hypothetical protein [Actinospica durhamensis]MBR7837206.1 hypothetical protein [Actinospica durhamensis]